MKTIPIATGIAAAALATTLLIAGSARSQSAPPPTDKDTTPELGVPGPPAPDDLMSFDLGDGPDMAPWDGEGAGPAFAPRASGRGMGMHRGPGGGRGMGFGRGDGDGMMLGPVGRLLHAGGRLAEELDLTSAQQDKLRDIADNLARTSIQARADLQVARLDMAKLVRADSPNRASIAAKIDDIARMRATQQKQVLDAALSARKVLTAEQLEKFKDLRPGMGHRHERGEWRGRGRAPGADEGQGQKGSDL